MSTSTHFLPRPHLDSQAGQLRYAVPPAQSALVRAHAHALHAHARADLATKLARLEPAMKRVSQDLAALAGTAVLTAVLGLPARWAGRFEHGRDEVRAAAAAFEDDDSPAFDGCLARFAAEAVLLETRLRACKGELESGFPGLNSAVLDGVFAMSGWAQLVVVAGDHYERASELVAQLEPYCAGAGGSNGDGDRDTAGPVQLVKTKTVADRDVAYRCVARFCLAHVAAYGASLAGCYRDVRALAQAAGESAGVVDRLERESQQAACRGRPGLAGAGSETRIAAFLSFSTAALAAVAAKDAVASPERRAVVESISSDSNRDALDRLVQAAATSWESSKTITGTSQTMPIASARQLSQIVAKVPAEVASEMASVAVAVPVVPAEAGIVDRLSREAALTSTQE